MAMTISELNGIIAQALARHTPTGVDVWHDEAPAEVLLELAKAGQTVVPIERLAAADSDGAAQAVCRALAEHEAHGGSIPWPSIRKPYDEWKAQRS